MARLPNASALSNLQEAAQSMGYRSLSTLRKVAREGRLQVIQPSSRVFLTTSTGVEE